MLEQWRSEGHPGVRSGEGGEVRGGEGGEVRGGEGGEVRGGGTGIGVGRNSARLSQEGRDVGDLWNIGPHTRPTLFRLQCLQQTSVLVQLLSLPSEVEQ